MELPLKNVTSKLIESVHLSVMLCFWQRQRQTACMWRIQMKEVSVVNIKKQKTHHARGPHYPVTHSKAQQTMNAK